MASQVFLSRPRSAQPPADEPDPRGCAPGYLRLNASGLIEEANEVAAALLRFRRRALIGYPLAAMMLPDDMKAFYLHRQQATAVDEVVTCDVMLRTRRTVQIWTKALWDAEQEPNGFSCALLDVPKRRSDQGNSDAGRVRVAEMVVDLKHIVSEVDEALFLREPDGRFSYVSPAFERIWNRPAQALVAEPTIWKRAIHPDDRERISRAEHLLRATMWFEETFRICRPDGEVRWVRCRLFRRGPEGKFRTAGVVQDVTRVHALEARLRQAQKLETFGKVASTIAHDFGNLLQGIMGCAVIAKDEAHPPEIRRQSLDKLLDAAERGSGLVEQLMTFVRKDGREVAPIPVDEVLGATAGLLERLLGAHHRLDVRPGAPGRLVRGSAVDIERILINLTVNARDAMPGGGVLRIVTEDVKSPGGRASPAVRLVVSDTGTGIGPAVKQRLFEDFFTTKPAGQGTGLGLTSVRAIVDGLGGAIEVQSAPDGGTSFSIELPCADPLEPLLPAAPAPGVRFRGRVLVVDDHSLARMSIGHFLAQLGFDVIEASDADEAIELCESRTAGIDLCLCDVGLPGKSGFWLVEQLQSRRPGLPFLLVSANAHDDLMQRGLIDGGAPFLAKPFTRAALADALGVLYRPAPESA